MSDDTARARSRFRSRAAVFARHGFADTPQASEAWSKRRRAEAAMDERVRREEASKPEPLAPFFFHAFIWTPET